MRDRFGRVISYLRISVTDRCNLRCRYCMPDGDMLWLAREDLLSFEEIVDVVRTGAELGINKVRLTGGEPLMRADILDLVAMLAKIRGIEDLSMTTNGMLLEQYAVDLAGAGLHRLNISIDAVDPGSHRERTRGGDVQRVKAGIRAARAAGFERIKLNCVVEESSNEPDALEVAAFAEETGCEARFIRRMELTAGQFWVVEGGSGGDCPRCDRLRLSPDGMIRPCLFSDVAFSVRELGVKEALLRAVETKPESGEQCHTTTFSRIGG